MRYFTVAVVVCLVVLQASVSFAQEGLPECGAKCIAKYLPQSTCAPTNVTCICTNAELNAQVGACVAVSCDIRDQLTTAKHSMESCGVKSRDRTTLVSVVALTFGALALLMVGLRVLSKFLSRDGGTFGLDDYFMIAATILEIPVAVFAVVLANNGLGRDIWAVSFEEIEALLYTYFWGELMYLAALPLTKISIILFYLRIFPSQGFRLWCYGMIAANVGYLLAFQFATIFQCSPVEGAWKHWDHNPAYKCNNINLQGWTSAGFNIVLDLGTLILPMPKLYSLSMSWRKKIQLMLMFSIGIFVTIVSILRLKTLLQFANSQNLTYDYVDPALWSTIELPVGIICGCLPSIRSLLRNIFPKVFASTDAGDVSGSSSTPMGSQFRKNSNATQFTTTRTTASNKPQRGDENSFIQLIEFNSRDVHNRV